MPPGVIRTFHFHSLWVPIAYRNNNGVKKAGLAVLLGLTCFPKDLPDPMLHNEALRESGHSEWKAQIIAQSYHCDAGIN
jgi:hypothetical protein